MVAKTIELPNIKKFFLPDPGFIIGDFDLKQADAQVVAYEADDDELKQIFKAGIDLHQANADVLGLSGKRGRQDAKQGVHLTNYGGTAYTLARTIGCTVRVAENFQRRWFQHHPGIKDWHDRVADSLATSRSVSNVFGYSNTYFDRVEGLLPEALAWIPQSTVALIISKAMLTLDEYYPCIQLLAQVHDSVVHQFRKEHQREALILTRRALEITCPYDDPLIIGSDADISSKSWGDVERVEWPEDTGESFDFLKTPEKLEQHSWI